MKILGVICGRVLQILFALMMLGIYFAVLYWNKIPENPFPSVALFHNGIYFAIAVLMAVGIWTAAQRREHRDISEKQFRRSLLCIMVVVMALHVCIARWMPIELARDFARVRKMAMHLAEGGTFADNGVYFVTNPNNVPITILFSWIMRVCGSWRAVIFIGMLCTNLSAVLTGMTVRNWTGRARAGILVCIFTEVLVGLTWRGFIPYTDNYGMLFVSLLLWEYSLPMHIKRKAPLIVLTAMIGSWIKVTVAIVLVGMVIHAILLGMENRKKASSGRIVSAIAAPLVLCIAIVIAGLATGKAIDRQYSFTTDEKHTMGWQYYFMMGQDESGLGTVAGKDYRLVKKEVNEKYDTKKERMDAFLQTGINYTRRKGICGNMIFVGKKLNLAYSDGQFHNMQLYEKEVADDSFLYQLYFRDGKYSFVIAECMQILWSLVLVMIGVSVIPGSGWRDDKSRLLKIILIGVTLYVLLFEVRSKYLFMFVPLYILLAVQAVSNYVIKKDCK